jgi:hypothetical protein
MLNASVTSLQCSLAVLIMKGSPSTPFHPLLIYRQTLPDRRCCCEDAEAWNNDKRGFPERSSSHASAASPKTRAADGSMHTSGAVLHHHGNDGQRVSARLLETR